VSSAKPPKSAHALRKLADAIAQHAIALSLLATCLSFISSFLTFQQWGLNYAIVATPTDIVVGGIEAMTTAIPVVIIGIIAAIIISLAKLQKLYPIYLLVIFTIALIGLILFVAFGFSFPVSLIAIFKGLRNWLDVAFIILIFLCVITSMALFVSKREHEATILFLLIPAILYLQTLSYLAANRSNQVVIFGRSDRCPSTEHLVWAGSASLVTSCSSPPYDSSKSYFVIERSDRAILVNAMPNEQSRR